MSAPCGGCPPCCNDCVFTPPDEGVRTPRGVKVVVIMKKAEYGCVRPDGGDVVVMNDTLGMMRGENFHPVTLHGSAFLKASENPLAAHC